MTKQNKRYTIPTLSPYILLERHDVEAVILRDLPFDKNRELRRYFRDLHDLFLNKLDAFVHSAHTTEEDEKRITKLFNEILSTRRILEEESQD